MNILCDIPNTLLDSRHRMTQFGPTITGILDDQVNYPCVQLVKLFMSKGYKVYFTHYCLTRLSGQVKTSLRTKGLPTEHIVTNYASQDVHDNATLKKFLSEQIDFSYVIDNDGLMESYWLNKEVGLIKVPLGIL